MKRKGIFGLEYVTDPEGCVEYAWKTIDKKTIRVYPYRETIKGQMVNASNVYTPGTIRKYIKKGKIKWGNSPRRLEVTEWLTE